MSRVNWRIAFLGVLFWYLETDFFGWNAHPSSVAELFADGMALAFFALACAFPPKPERITIVIQTKETP